MYPQYPNQPPPVPPAGPPPPWTSHEPVYVPAEGSRRGPAGGPSRGRRRGISPRSRRSRNWASYLPILLPICMLGFILAAYLLLPLRTNILILGIDYTDPGSSLGRSDTLILTTFNPLRPSIGMLSIPRDLWVNIPGAGQNRINTAHFFGEAQRPGSGPATAMEAIRENFGVDVGYYIRIHFDGVRDIVNALGGVDINLPQPMAGYEAGWQHLTGNKALAFARQRMGSDDFFRMEHGQLLMKAIFKNMLNPLKWVRMPLVGLAVLKSIDTNVPLWVWPRLAGALLRAGPNGIDSRTITRLMATPFTTDQGASVLIPNWDLINPVLKEMFGQ